MNPIAVKVMATLVLALGSDSRKLGPEFTADVRQMIEAEYPGALANFDADNCPNNPLPTGADLIVELNHLVGVVHHPDCKCALHR